MGHIINQTDSIGWAKKQHCQPTYPDMCVHYINQTAVVKPKYL